MKITGTIAWRNVWRNPRRTWVLITSIAIGIFGHLSTSAFNRGFLDQMVEAAINLRGGHILIAPKGYHENPQIRLCISDPDRIFSAIEGIPNVQGAPLISLQGMVNSADTSAGVAIQGIEPGLESRISIISQAVSQGEYLRDDENSTGDILIGEALAEKLNVRLGEKIVLMVSDIRNEISSAAFRISGFYHVPSADFEKVYVYIRKTAAQKIAGYGDEITGISVRLADKQEVETIADELGQKLGDDLEVLSWQERNPLLVISMELFDESTIIVAVIMFIAIAFTIANSFLMVIYERIQEIGIMMANGVLPKRIRRMLYVEAFFVTVLGAALGLAANLILIGYLGATGLNLADFADGLGSFGIGTTVYPQIWAFDIFVGLIGILVVVFLSILYPAIKASRFQVVDAIRFV